MENTMKKSTFKTLVVFASLMSITSVFATNTSETAIISFGKFVHSVEKLISDFFNSSNKTAYNTYVIEFEKVIQEARRLIEPTTRGACDALTKEVYDVVDYALQQFSVAYNIIKKYNGKPSSEAQTFGLEIKRDFNPEKIFAELIVKLQALKGKALQAQECGTVKKIDAIIKLIETKRKEWNAKPEWVLFAGLTNRMTCK